jgi:uncharacterized protein
MSRPTPSEDELDDALLSCRYGDLDDLNEFIEKFGDSHLSGIRDANGSTILHMACANGHAGALAPLWIHEKHLG